MNNKTVYKHLSLITVTLGCLLIAAGSSYAQYQPAGGEFSVHAVSGEHQNSAKISVAQDGTFVVCWDSEGQDTDGESAHARLFNAEGEPISDEILLHTFTQNDQTSPSVDMTPSNGFVAAWESHNQAGENSSLDIYARIFDNNGTPQSEEFLVSETSDHNQMLLQVETAPATGNIVIVWMHAVVAESDIFFRIFDPAGNPLTGDIRVNDDAGDHYLPSLAMDHDGNFGICWGLKHNNQFDIHARLYDSQGQPAGPSFLINNTQESDQHDPDIAMNGSGDFVVVWDTLHEGKMDAYARFFTRDGTPKGDEIKLNETNEGYAPRVALTDNGITIAVWESAVDNHSDIFAQVLTEDGTVLSNDFLIHSESSLRQIVPDIDVSPDGMYFAAAWVHIDESNTTDVNARIFKYFEPGTAISNFTLYE